MLRTRNDQPSLWESVLPEVCLRLPVELERVDAWLDNERFFAPFRAHFDARLGRPSLPLETYLRLMFLKFRYPLGYETLCREVSDSISWRRFCRIDIDGRVPHPTTLMKVTTQVRGRHGADVERGIAGQSSRGEGGEDGISPRRHHRGVGQR
jgi:transposase, IS5 family